MSLNHRDKLTILERITLWIMDPPYKGPWAYFVRCTSCDLGFTPPESVVPALCPLCGANAKHRMVQVGRLIGVKNDRTVWEWRDPD